MSKPDRAPLSLSRVHGIAKSTTHRWQANFGGMSRDDAERLKQLEDANRRRETLR